MNTLRRTGNRTGRFILGGMSCLLAVAAGPLRADEGPEPPPIPRTKGFAYYASLVNSMLPSFDSSLLSVPGGPDWMAGKTVHQVAVAVQDSDPARIESDGPILMGYDPPDGPRRIKLDFSEGYIRYTNRDRSFHPGSPCAAAPEPEAENALLATVAALALPTSEWGSRRVDMVMERSVDGEAQDPTPEGTCEIERMVTMTRKAANGLPILDSRVRETFSNLHERARLLIDWPKFALGGGLMMRARAEVVDDMARRIWEAERDPNGLGSEVDLEIQVGYTRTADGYAPVARGTFTDIYNRYAGQAIYVPLAENPSSGVNPAAPAEALLFRVRTDRAGGSALLEFSLPRAETVRLTVADVGGREVAVLAEGAFSAGWHQVSWGLLDRSQRRVPSGVYFARLSAGRETPARKMLVIR